MNKRASRLFESLEYTIGISGTHTVIDGYYVQGVSTLSVQSNLQISPL